MASNAVKRIGLPLTNDSSDFGSAGRLMSVIYHSFGGIDIADHEIAHTWGAGIGASLGLIEEGLSGRYHWNKMSDIGGQLGYYYFDSSGHVGHFSYNGDNTWRLILNTTNEQYSPIELYVMGLISPQEVPPIHILTAPDLTNTERITAGSVCTVTIDDIIAAEGGAREPSSASSQKDFNLAFIVTDDRPYNDAAYAFFSAFARSMMTRNAPVQSSYYSPFYWATGGRATLNTSLPVSGSPPAEATLISPSGNITASTPEYRWNAVASATSYCLWVNDASASPRLQQSFTTTQAGCASGSGACSVTPAVTLPSSDCQWWIQPRNYAGYGPWSTPLSFTVTTGTPAKANMYFAQLAIGGGYTTTFTFVNTGADASSGTLILTDDDGTSLNATLATPDRAGIIASSYPITVSPGGTESIIASGVSSSEPTKVGWARVESSGGSLGGVATFQFVNGSALQTTVGVLSGSATITATIPIDDDLTLGAQSHSTGYAVVNPGNDNVYISLTVTNQDGSISKTINPATLNPLGPGRHSARFFWQDLDPNWQFKGSITLSAGAGQTFSVVALVMNQGLYTAIPAVSPLSRPGQSTTTNRFAHIAVGEGFTTNFTLLNTGTDATSGTMTLSDDDGTPLNATLASPGQANVVASSYPISLAPGGTQSITASGVSPGDTTKAGSAGVASSGGSLGGVATFQFMDSNRLTTIVGVLSSGATNSATIPIDDDLTLGAQSRSTGYAVANPGNEDIHIRLLLINPDGSTARALDPFTLKAGAHSARFFWQDLADDKLKFRGSVVLIADSGKSFSVVALVLDQGLYTAVPVIPGKAPRFN